MFCIALQKHVNESECYQRIWESDKAGITLCRSCAFGQRLMHTVPQRMDSAMRECEKLLNCTLVQRIPQSTIEETISTQEADTMDEAKNHYSYQEIAELADVPHKAVANTVYRMRQGIVPKKGNAQKIADCLASHSITLDMIGGGGPGRTKIGKPEKPTVAPEEPTASSQDSPDTPCEEQADSEVKNSDDGCGSVDDTRTNHREALVASVARIRNKFEKTGFLPPIEEEVTPGNVYEGKNCISIDYSLRQFRTEDLLRELKDRNPSATITISL